MSEPALTTSQIKSRGYVLLTDIHGILPGVTLNRARKLMKTNLGRYGQVRLKVMRSTSIRSIGMNNSSWVVTPDGVELLRLDMGLPLPT